MKFTAKKEKEHSSIKNVLSETTFYMNVSHLVICPKCGFDYCHPATPSVIDNGDYENEWDGRGALIVIPFEGECGHNFRVCFGFHKGHTLIFTQNGSNDAPNEEEIEESTKESRPVLLVKAATGESTDEMENRGYLTHLTFSKPGETDAKRPKV